MNNSLEVVSLLDTALWGTGTKEAVSHEGEADLDVQGHQTLIGDGAGVGPVQGELVVVNNHGDDRGDDGVADPDEDEIDGPGNLGDAVVVA